MVTNIKLPFTNVPFRDNSACVIQKWFRFKRVIPVRLAYILSIFPNRSKIILLLFSKSCIFVNLLKTEVLCSHQKEDYS